MQNADLHFEVVGDPLVGGYETSYMILTLSGTRKRLSFSIKDGKREKTILEIPFDRVVGCFPNRDYYHQLTLQFKTDSRKPTVSMELGLTGGGGLRGAERDSLHALLQGVVEGFWEMPAATRYGYPMLGTRSAEVKKQGGFLNKDLRQIVLRKASLDIYRSKDATYPLNVLQLGGLRVRSVGALDLELEVAGSASAATSSAVTAPPSIPIKGKKFLLIFPTHDDRDDWEGLLQQQVELMSEIPPVAIDVLRQYASEQKQLAAKPPASSSTSSSTSAASSSSAAAAAGAAAAAAAAAAAPAVVSAAAAAGPSALSGPPAKPRASLALAAPGPPDDDIPGPPPEDDAPRPPLSASPDAGSALAIAPSLLSDASAYTGLSEIGQKVEAAAAAAAAAQRVRRSTVLPGRSSVVGAGAGAPPARRGTVMPSAAARMSVQFTKFAPPRGLADDAHEEPAPPQSQPQQQQQQPHVAASPMAGMSVPPSRLSVVRPSLSGMMPPPPPPEDEDEDDDDAAADAPEGEGGLPPPPPPMDAETAFKEPRRSIAGRPPSVSVAAALSGPGAAGSGRESISLPPPPPDADADAGAGEGEGEGAAAAAEPEALTFPPVVADVEPNPEPVLIGVPQWLVVPAGASLSADLFVYLADGAVLGRVMMDVLLPVRDIAGRPLHRIAPMPDGGIPDGFILGSNGTVYDAKFAEVGSLAPSFDLPDDDDIDNAAEEDEEDGEGAGGQHSAPPVVGEDADASFSEFMRQRPSISERQRVMLSQVTDEQPDPQAMQIETPPGVLLPPRATLASDLFVYIDGTVVGQLVLTPTLPFKDKSGATLHRILLQSATLPLGYVLASNGSVYDAEYNEVGTLDIDSADDDVDADGEGEVQTVASSVSRQLRHRGASAASMVSAVEGVPDSVVPHLSAAGFDVGVEQDEDETDDDENDDTKRPATRLPPTVNSVAGRNASLSLPADRSAAAAPAGAGSTTSADAGKPAGPASPPLPARRASIAPNAPLPAVPGSLATGAAAGAAAAAAVASNPGSSSSSLRLSAPGTPDFGAADGSPPVVDRKISTSASVSLDPTLAQQLRAVASSAAVTSGEALLVLIRVEQTVAPAWATAALAAAAAAAAGDDDGAETKTPAVVTPQPQARKSRLVGALAVPASAPLTEVRRAIKELGAAPLTFSFVWPKPQQGQSASGAANPAVGLGQEARTDVLQVLAEDPDDASVFGPHSPAASPRGPASVRSIILRSAAAQSYLTPASASARKTLTVLLEGISEPLGQVDISELLEDESGAASLADLRSMLADELDDLPAEYVFVLDGIKVARKQEVKRPLRMLTAGSIVIRNAAGSAAVSAVPPPPVGLLPPPPMGLLPPPPPGGLLPPPPLRTLGVVVNKTSQRAQNAPAPTVGRNDLMSQISQGGFKLRKAADRTDPKPVSSPMNGLMSLQSSLMSQLAARRAVVQEKDDADDW